MPENQEAVDVYLLVRNQVITTAMGSVVDISFPAVKVVMDLMGVEDQQDCFFRVHHLFHEFRPRGENG